MFRFYLCCADRGLGGETLFNVECSTFSVPSVPTKRVREGTININIIRPVQDFHREAHYILLESTQHAPLTTYYQVLTTVGIARSPVDRVTRTHQVPGNIFNRRCPPSSSPRAHTAVAVSQLTTHAVHTTRTRQQAQQRIPYTTLGRGRREEERHPEGARDNNKQNTKKGRSSRTVYFFCFSNLWAGRGGDLFHDQNPPGSSAKGPGMLGGERAVGAGVFSLRSGPAVRAHFGSAFA